jgi:glycosyltransferase involved in cell wall biosynthesis
VICVNTNPLVCVVVPILNEVRYIRESMDSLLAQDYQPLEIIVYDGGSTDGTLDILKTYSVELIVEPGLGQMAAINRGWRRTSAEFVTWWAGDDVYKPKAISRLAEELQAHPEAGFVHADGGIIDEAGNVIAHMAPGDIQLRDLVTAFTMLPQSALIRHAALERTGMMDETRRLAADWDLFLRLAQYYPIHYVRFTAALRRMHAGSEDAQNTEAIGEAAIDVMDCFFERPDLKEEQRALKKRGIAGSHLIAGWCYCVAGKHQKAWRMLIEAVRSAPPLVLTTQAGRRLLFRLLVPIKVQANGRTLNPLIGRVFPHL